MALAAAPTARCAMADPVPNAIPCAIVDPIPESMPPEEDWVAGGAAAGRGAGGVAVVDAWRRCGAGLEKPDERPPRLERCLFVNRVEVIVVIDFCFQIDVYDCTFT